MYSILFLNCFLIFLERFLEGGHRKINGDQFKADNFEQSKLASVSADYL